MRGALAGTRLSGLMLLCSFLLASSCRHNSPAIVVVVVKVGSAELEGKLHSLRVVAEAASRTDSHDYRPSDGTPVRFPTSFSFSVDRAVAGPLDLEIQGLDLQGRPLANATAVDLQLKAGSTSRVEVSLICIAGCLGAQPDGGASPDGAPLPDQRNCGNGRLDLSETCDVAIAAGLPGACPTNECNDGVSCTKDFKRGSGCTVQCVHEEIAAFSPGDGCCPTNGTHELDEDCSASCGNGTVDAPEACDVARAAGTAAACPTVETCNDGVACTQDRLISANTCAARCTHQVVHVALAGDSCCPASATAETDSDCRAVCGNGLLDPGEACDVAIAAGRDDACPRQCDDGDACTVDTLIGSGCQTWCSHVQVAEPLAGDGCCPPKATATVDPECPNRCGDGVVEPGETCDKAIATGQPGACPTQCPAPLTCMSATFSGRGEDCTARCVVEPIATCSGTQADGCCAAKCGAATDVDCSPTCGNGLLEPGETCDTAIAPPGEGTCPRACGDDLSCTADLLLSGDTCHARCAFLPITGFLAGDMCCPPGANGAVDPDCPTLCGNGIVELPRETCDRNIPAGEPGACVLSCSAPTACSTVALTGRADLCTARCQTREIAICSGGDGCCPSMCSTRDDTDCPAVCGNGVIDAGENCDRGITAGNPGACPSTCDDGISCTSDLATGKVETCTRLCTHTKVTACAAGDGCCPAACSFATDSDCASLCGNGVVEDGETCDPEASCPTSCKDDGDLCTSGKLEGDPALCTARCTHVPIRECSALSDQCCASSCMTPASDPDCRQGLTPPLMSLPI